MLSYHTKSEVVGYNPLVIIISLHLAYHMPLYYPKVVHVPFVLTSYLQAEVIILQIKNALLKVCYMDLYHFE